MRIEDKLIYHEFTNPIEAHLTTSNLARRFQLLENRLELPIFAHIKVELAEFSVRLEPESLVLRILNVNVH